MTLVHMGTTLEIAGRVFCPGDDAYDLARRGWNDMVSARPGFIVRCATVGDVVSAVRFALDEGLEIAVRGGGHSVAGLSTCDGGLVVDLRDLRAVTVDPVAGTASVEPGATWADVDACCGRHGLATTGGLISTTGVAGLTLGGGIGWLQRRYGLACDNLRAADVVTASAVTVNASDDLLWGLRGGGGNFGVVTRFSFDLHPVSTVLGGLMLFPLARGREVLQAFREWAADAPDEATLLAAVLTAPPEPFVPADLVGQPVLALVGCWCGDLDAGPAALRPLRDLGPAADLFGPMPYPALQQILDASAPPGRRNYFRGGFAADLTDAVIDAVLEHSTRMPSRFSQIHLHQMGGQVGRLGADTSAFSGRAAGYTFNLVSSWTDPAEDEIHLTANRAAADALAPHAMTASYVNFITAGFDAAAAYGTDIHLRLARLKREYDPGNIFHRNQNIRPAA